jgi:hypothetical protein
LRLRFQRVHRFIPFDDPSPEVDPLILAQLVDELQTKSQQFLTEQLALQSGLVVIPFEETRRRLADLAPTGAPLTAEQVDALASQSGADVVITGLIHDYVRWQYWVTGLAIHATTELVLVGFARGWNPAIVVPFFFFDVATDMPIWYGGAYVFGWAFRPVRVGLEATQVRNCRGLVWNGEELAIHVPGKILAEYAAEERSKKEIQLEANLKWVMSVRRDHRAEAGAPTLSGRRKPGEDIISCQSWTSCTELSARDQSATAMMALGPSSLVPKYKHLTEAACVTPPPCSF